MDVRSTVSCWSAVKSTRTGTIPAVGRTTNGNPRAWYRRFCQGFVTEDKILAAFVSGGSVSFSQVNATKVRVERMVPSRLTYSIWEREAHRDGAGSTLFY